MRFPAGADGSSAALRGKARFETAAQRQGSRGPREAAKERPAPADSATEATRDVAAQWRVEGCLAPPVAAPQTGRVCLSC